MWRRSTDDEGKSHGRRRLLRSRVARRVFGSFVACALVPLGVFAWIAQGSVTKELESSARAQLTEALRLDGANVLYRLGIVLEEVRRIADGVDGAVPSGPVAVSHSAGFEGIVVRRDGTRTVLLGRDFEPPELRAGERECLAETGQAIAFRSSAKEGDLAFIVLERKGAGPETRIDAVVAGASIWGGLDPDGSGVVSVFDEAGGRLHGPDEDEVPRAALFRAWASDPHGAVFAAEGRQEGLLVAHRRFFTKPQFGTNLVFVRHKGLDEVLSPVRAFRRLMILAAVLALLLVMLASVRLIGRTLDPLTRLLQVTKSVRTGDYSARIELSCGDEFQELADSFNGMTAGLRDAQAQEEAYRRELEVARDDALAAARTQAEIVQNVSHELRTPVTSALAATEILESYGAGDPAVTAEFLPVVKSQVLRLQGLIEGVLTFSDVRSNEEWGLADVDVGESLREAIDASAAAARARRVTLSLNVDPSLPAIRADAHRCQLAWRALLDNAIKFNVDGGQVRVRAFRDGDALLLEFDDEGCGVAPADRVAIFEPFRQSSEDLTTAKPPGVGLGLSIARRVVERLGGSIEVDDAPGGGARFRVRLPARPGTRPTVPAASRVAVP